MTPTPRHVPLLIILAATYLAATPASAQTGAGDVRWRPWLGCWIASPPAAARASEMVCVVPAQGTSAVDVITLNNGSVTTREHLDATGAHLASTRDNCTGWQSATWSADARRIYLQAEYQCATTGTRTSSGLMTMTPGREWLDVMAVTSGGNTGVRVLRHGEAAVPESFPAEITAPLEAIPSAAIQEARALASSPVKVADILEASKQIHSAAVEAWIAQVQEHFRVDGKQLVEFARAGMPDRVIDMMVALSYPSAFAIAPSASAAGVLARDEGRRGSGGVFGRFDGFGVDAGPCGFGYSLFGWDQCGAFGYSPFGLLPSRMLPFGYAAYYPYFGAGYGLSGYGGWYQSEVPVIVLRPGTGDGQAHGQVINGRGYTSGDAGSTAVGSSSGSSSGSSGSGSVGSSGGGDGGRTAQPR